MPALRRCGGSASMRRSPNRIWPRSRSQKPATMRRSVVLPQPDGPRRVKNSPSRTASETSSMARTLPKVRATRSMVIPANSASLLDRLLDAIHRLAALGRPASLVVLHDLEVREPGHLAGQVGQVEVLARRAAERLLEDHLAHVLAIHVVDELARPNGVRSALDDG